MGSRTKTMSHEDNGDGLLKKIVCRTRSSGITFSPIETHDMVRSLFDPTIRKSFLEYCVIFSIVADVALCYWVKQAMGFKFAKYFFLGQYIVWRLLYNVGIGYALQQQSEYEGLSNYVKKHQLFEKKNTSRMSRFCKFEIKTKFGEEFKVDSVPSEYLAWLLFRQFVDLVLMQDFTNYILFVYFSLPTNQDGGFKLLNASTICGVIMLLLNVWIKLDAHRVVTDYAWYWGDFFFLQDAELTFDGVFNIVPHPMYSLGYLGYYGFSIICGDYKLLMVSICGHVLQFLFLKYVENPHIEKIYGSDKPISDANNIDDIIIKENNDYSKPLISNGLYFENFMILRFTDLFTVTSVILLFGWVITHQISSDTLFLITSSSKLASWLLNSSLLYNQSKHRSFTKLFLKNGFTQIYSYKQWQFIYNYTLSLTTSLLILQTSTQLYENYSNINYLNILFGLLLCAIQIWCNAEIREAISDFGYFYGDFFLTNYIRERKLTSQGIFRYLNNPDAFLSNCGVLGSALMTNFNNDNITLVIIWIITNLLFNKFIEQPHVKRVYGNSKRVGGVEQSLSKIKPLRSLFNVLDTVESALVNKIMQDKESEMLTRTQSRSEWETTVATTIRNVKTNLAPNCVFEVENTTNDGFALPNPIKVNWQLPSEIYNCKDWIGLYNVLSVRSDYKKTRISSFGHWCATSKDGYGTSSKNVSIDNFTKSTDIVKGSVIFDQELLIYEPGIYEFRYHSKSSHNVLLLSDPIEIKFPTFSTNDANELYSNFIATLSSIGSLQNDHFDEHANKYFNIKSFAKLIHSSTGVELSPDFIRNVNGDIHIISNKICEIKDILNDLS